MPMENHDAAFLRQLRLPHAVLRPPRDAVVLEALAPGRGPERERPEICHVPGEVFLFVAELLRNALKITAVLLIYVGRTLRAEAISEAVRDFVFEVAQNALTHGSASKFTVRFSPKRIELLDDGVVFDARTLSKLLNRRGGGMAAENLYKIAGDQLLITTKWLNGQNHHQIQFIRTQADITSEPLSSRFHIRYCELGRGIKQRSKDSQRL